METKYKKVPDIISTKDLDYLADMFNWNYIGYKMTYNTEEIVYTKEICDVLKQTSSLFYDNMNTILDTINELGENANE